MSKFSIQNMLDRYELLARSRGHSQQTITITRISAGKFDDFMDGIPDIRKVKDDDLRRFIVSLQDNTGYQGTPRDKGKKLSPTSTNTYVRMIKGLWALLKEEKIIDRNPLAGVKAPKPAKTQPKIYTAEEIAAIFRAVAKMPRELALLAVLLDTGITLSEIAALNDTDVDTNGGTMRVYRPKTKMEKQVYFTAPTAGAIEAYRRVRPEPVAEPRLFLTRDGYPLKEARIQQILARIGVWAGISQRLSAHKFRHSCATFNLRAGASLEHVRLMLGHKDIRTTSEFYSHLVGKDISDAQKHTSPVITLGVLRQPGKTKKAKRQKKPSKIKMPNQHPYDGVMPVVYGNEKKARRKKERGR